MKKILLTISCLVVTFSSAQAWNIAGNNGTNPSTNFLGTIDAQPLIFKTNNSEKARITPNGNVGIGTTNPQAKLEINDGFVTAKNSNVAITPTNKVGFRINELGNDVFEMSYARDGLGILKMKTFVDNPISFGTANTERMRITSNGNVGIGTASPQAKLDVNGDIHLQGLGKIYGWNDPSNYYIGKYSVTGSSGLDIHWYGGIKFGTV